MAMKRGLSRQSVRDFYISLDYLGNLASFYLGFDGRRTLSRPILGGRFSIHSASPDFKFLCDNAGSAPGVLTTD